MGEQEFTKKHRLLNSFEFDAVFKGKDYRIGTPEFLILAKHNNEANSRIGMVIGKKTTKLAVNRSKVKRAIRESFRKNFPKNIGLDIVIVSRPAINQFLDSGLVKKLTHSWVELNQKVLCRAESD
ncbi:MAG: ribonuclease P protein component [Candidatus Azotimanducaceae bacterium]|jgi:ribonuclease P protein component